MTYKREKIVDISQKIYYIDLIMGSMRSQKKGFFRKLR